MTSINIPGRMRGPPQPIFMAQARDRGSNESSSAGLTIVNPNGAFPFVNLSTAIGEGKGGRIAMQGTAVIHCVRRGSDHIHTTIVDCPRIVIYEGPNFRGPDGPEIAHSPESGIGCVGNVTMG